VAVPAVLGALLLPAHVEASTDAEAPAAAPVTFLDVTPRQPFFGHITWLAEQGIATGFADGGFHPTAPISRAAMAAFLYRVAGEPAFDPPTTATFTDVSTRHRFATEVEWLASEGITTGYDDGTFRPTAATSRQAMAAYLHRASGAPSSEPPATPTFPDVPSTGEAFLEVEWLVAEQVATGFADGGFHPLEPVSRQAMAAFVFRQQHRAPTLVVDPTFVTGRERPWDLAWTPDGALLFTERISGLWVRRADGQVARIGTPGQGGLADIGTNSETGLLGLELDPDFATNRTFYTCQGENDPGGSPMVDDVQVVQWTVDAGYTAVSKVRELVDMAPWATSSVAEHGAHGGCRPRFGPDGRLWVTAGDTRCGSYPQDRTQLAGKVLRLDVHAPFPHVPVDNPFVGGDPADDLVWSFGHRNPQGLAPRPGSDQMWSVEHGSDVDDEVNLLVRGGNFGWDPTAAPDPSGGCGYQDVGTPMTDLAAFPDAVPARWDTGGPTVATSGATWLEGDSWGGWEGALVIGTLKGRHLRVQLYTDGGVFVEERIPPALLQTFGRLRTPRMGPSEDLFITTDEAGPSARILRVSASP
jgi:glucose/arabinose dehydrogenase